MQSSVSKPTAPSSPSSSDTRNLILGSIGVIVFLVLLSIFFFTLPPSNIPTKISVNITGDLPVNSSNPVKIILLDYDSKPIANKNITISNGDVTKASTDSSGAIEKDFIFNNTGLHKISIIFSGDSKY